MARINTSKLQVVKSELLPTDLLELTELDDSEIQSISGGGCFGVGYKFNQNTGCIGIVW